MRGAIGKRLFLTPFDRLRINFGAGYAVMPGLTPETAFSSDPTKAHPGSSPG
jgi:hypothetical protein